MLLLCPSYSPLHVPLPPPPPPAPLNRLMKQQLNYFFHVLDTKTTWLNQKQISVLVLHIIFQRLTVVSVSFCSLIKGITPKIRMLWFVLTNSLLFNLIICLDLLQWVLAHIWIVYKNRRNFIYHNLFHPFWISCLCLKPTVHFGMNFGIVLEVLCCRFSVCHFSLVSCLSLSLVISIRIRRSLISLRFLLPHQSAIFICILVIIIIMYIYHALVNALSAHMILTNLNMIFHTHIEQSSTKTIYINDYNANTHTHARARAHACTRASTHTHTHTHTQHNTTQHNTQRHARTHARTHTHTHTHTHTDPPTVAETGYWY